MSERYIFQGAIKPEPGNYRPFPNRVCSVRQTYEYAHENEEYPEYDLELLEQETLELLGLRPTDRSADILAMAERADFLRNEALKRVR